jgi:putative PIN family toxin of toxin-antitoxin system
MFVVIDTNVLAGALLGSEKLNRRVLRACLTGQVKPILGQALFLEYEDVLQRDQLFKNSPLTRTERMEFFAAFLSVCRWVPIYYTWRPNLRDEGDNHLVELAIAGGADAIVTRNLKDFRGADLKFPSIRILDPKSFDKEFL